MASKLSLVLVLAAAALASAQLTVTLQPARGSHNTYHAGSNPIINVRVNNWEEGIDGRQINCYAYYAYLDLFGQTWAHAIDQQIMSCNSGRTGNCNVWTFEIPQPADNSKVIEAVAYCRHNNGQRIWAQGSGNAMFQQAN
eukprot:m51a1_g5163 hypothetical protein (140) ;mRNA; f:118072-118572